MTFTIKKSQTADDIAITGIGLISPAGIGRNVFFAAIQTGKNCLAPIQTFATDSLRVKIGGEVKGFNPDHYLDLSRLRNVDKSTFFLLVSSKLAMEDGQLDTSIVDKGKIGVCTGATYPHIWALHTFNEEVFTEGVEFADPCYYPSVVGNAASSRVSIYYGINGFNTTLSSNFCSSLTALEYSLSAIHAHLTPTVLCSSFETLDVLNLIGAEKMSYIGGISGPPISCPFDTGRNGPIYGEGAVSFLVESVATAAQRNSKPQAIIKSVVSSFDHNISANNNPNSDCFEQVIRSALREARVDMDDIDYISSSANSTEKIDRLEAKALKNVFGETLAEIPVSSIKSMIGETVSASGGMQIASCIGVFQDGIIPPTINIQKQDSFCDFNCVPNLPITKEINTALVITSGPVGHLGACVLTKAV